MHRGTQSHSLKMAAHTKVCPNVQFSTSNALRTQATHLQFKDIIYCSQVCYVRVPLYLVKMWLPQPSFKPTYLCQKQNTTVSEHGSCINTDHLCTAHIQVTLAVCTSMPSSIRMCKVGLGQSWISLTCSRGVQERELIICLTPLLLKKPAHNYVFVFFSHAKVQF